MDIDIDDIDKALEMALEKKKPVSIAMFRFNERVLITFQIYFYDMRKKL